MTLATNAGAPCAETSFALPRPSFQSDFSVERALFVRRSIREYTSDPITVAELSQLLWACQGITSVEGFRTAPSGGAVFPLETYVCLQSVTGLPDGVYHYLPGLTEHKLELVRTGQFGGNLFELSTKQDFIKQVPVNIILGTVTSRMVEKYGEAMAPRYVYMEMGHAAQNVHLQAEALGLGSVAVGYLNEKAVQDLFMLGNVEPVYMISVGRKA
jgi:SagB-type dehydrogenase family enzyme